MKPKPGLRWNAYELISRAVEAGVAYGYNRAHKHGKPKPEALKEAIEREVITELCEVLIFEDE